MPRAVPIAGCVTAERHAATLLVSEHRAECQSFPQRREHARFFASEFLQRGIQHLAPLNGGLNQAHDYATSVMRVPSISLL